VNLTLHTAGLVVELIGFFASTQYFRVEFVVFVALGPQLFLVILLRFIKLLVYTFALLKKVSFVS
jgi:hypothetical protein